MECPLLQWPQVRDRGATRTHQAATPKKAPPSRNPGVEHQCGTETAPAQSELAGGLLTGRGGSRPGSAEDAADQPERKRCPAAGSPGHRHPSPPASRYSKGSLRRDAVRLSEGVSEGDGPSSGATESQAPPASSSSPLTRSALQSGGAGSSGAAAAFLFPARGSCLSLCEPMPGGGIQTEKEREGGAEEGTPTPPSPSRGKRKKKKNHQGTRRKTRRAEEAEGAGSTPATAVRRSPLRASAPPAAGQRESEGFPVARQLTRSDCVCAERSTQPGGRTDGRAHARPQRGAARGSLSQAVQREQRRPRPEGWERRRQQRLRSRAAGEAGGSPPSSPRLQAPPWLLLRRRRLLLTLPLRLSQTFCPALASLGNRRGKEPRAPGPSAGARAEEGGARLSPGGRRC